MAENEAVEVEMCDCGCGNTKEETVQALMRIRGCDHDEAERVYVEFGETITDDDKQFRDFVAAIVGDRTEQIREHEKVLAEAQRAKEAGEEMCPCDCGLSGAQVITGFVSNGLTKDQATTLYERCATAQRENAEGVTPELMQQFLNEVAPGMYEVQAGE